MLTESISYPAAFAAGLLSFLSPCILPLIPAYFTFITGCSVTELTDGEPSAKLRRRVMVSTLAYVVGFSSVFIALGASASFLGGLLFDHRDTLRVVGGILILILGVHMTGLIRFAKLDVEKRLHLSEKPMGIMGTVLVGMAFAAGWSPCIGPLLGSILIVAGNQDTVFEGMLLLSAYSAGLALPFLGLSAFIHLLLSFLKRAKTVLKYVNPAAGVLLIILGILLVINKVSLY